MGTIPLPIPWADFHRGHPPAFAYGQPYICPLCGRERDDSASDLAQARAAHLSKEAAVRRLMKEWDAQ